MTKKQAYNQKMAIMKINYKSIIEQMREDINAGVDIEEYAKQYSLKFDIEQIAYLKNNSIWMVNQDSNDKWGKIYKLIKII